MRIVNECPDNEFPDKERPDHACPDNECLDNETPDSTGVSQRGGRAHDRAEAFCGSLCRARASTHSTNYVA